MLNDRRRRETVRQDERVDSLDKKAIVYMNPAKSWTSKYPFGPSFLRLKPITSEKVAGSTMINQVIERACGTVSAQNPTHNMAP